VNEPVNAADYLDAAAARVDPKVWCFFEGGAGDEVTLRANAASFRRWRLRPRVLVDVGAVSAESTVLGTPVSMPLLVAPFAMQRLLHPDGELATARATAGAGTLMCVSTVTTCAHEDIAAAAGAAPRWLQLYVLEDRGLTREHLAAAQDCGYSALVLTVDIPMLGRRERDLRLGFEIPPDLPLPYIRGQGGTPMQQQLQMSRTMTWRDLGWVAGESGLPLVLKGVLTREDATLGVEHGADAIIVSNHGGRQLDGVAATLDALPEVVDAVAGRCEVYVDGGVRRGTDVLKALALGARAALVARPVAAALAVDGEAGVGRLLELLREEIENGLALLGCTSPDEVARGHVEPTVPYDPVA